MKFSSGLLPYIEGHCDLYSDFSSVISHIEQILNQLKVVNCEEFYSFGCSEGHCDLYSKTTIFPIILSLFSVTDTIMIFS